VSSAEPVKSFSLRIIPYENMSGACNMALDNYFALDTKSDSDVIMRFYGWQPYCVSIGYHQKISIIDQKKLFDDEFDLVRRPTGGRAIFHARELTYSIISSKKYFHHQDLYLFSHRIIANALNELGYDLRLTTGMDRMPAIKQTAGDFPCFTRSAETEIQHNGRKVVGSAQKIYKNATLQHGSILIGNDHKNLIRWLRGNEEEIDAAQTELDQKTVCLNDIKKTEISSEKIITTVVKQLESLSHISVYFKELTSIERECSHSYEIPV